MSNRLERRQWNAYCRRMSLDAALWHESEPNEPLPLSWGYMGKREHYASALDRWLQAQIGKHWDNIYSRLCYKFPRRSWRGHRILEEQIRCWIGFEDDPHSGWCYLIVDHDGILRSGKDYEWHRGRNLRPQRKEPYTWPVNEQHILDLDALMDGQLNHAYFIVVSGSFCWVEVTRWFVETVWIDGEERERYHPAEYTRTRKLTGDEVDYLQSLCGCDYRSLRWRSGVNSRKGQNSWRHYKGNSKLPEVTLRS